MVQSVVYIDGALERLDPDDRGLSYGDGLFETMLADGGRIRWLDYHLDRLAEGCRRLAIEPLEREQAVAEILRRVPGAGTSVVKLLLTRGCGPRGYAPPADPVVNVMIRATPFEVGTGYFKPVRAALLALRLSESEILAGIKHLCRIEQVLAQLELRSRALEEGVLLSRSGKVVGCTSSNLFLIRDAEVLTPKIESAGIAGVMRRVVIEACGLAGIDVREADIDVPMLSQAVGLFQTNALIGIREIVELDGRSLCAGARLGRIREAVRELADA